MQRDKSWGFDQDYNVLYLALSQLLKVSKSFESEKTPGVRMGYS